MFALFPHEMAFNHFPPYKVMIYMYINVVELYSLLLLFSVMFQIHRSSVFGEDGFAINRPVSHLDHVSRIMHIHIQFILPLQEGYI